MLYTPIPGTALYEKHRRDGSLIPETEFPLLTPTVSTVSTTATRTSKDGRERGISPGCLPARFYSQRSKPAQDDTGASHGWQLYRDEAPATGPEAHLAWEIFPCARPMPGLYVDREVVSGTIGRRKKGPKTPRDISAAFGWTTRIVAPLFGFFALVSAEAGRREDMAGGWTYEPGSFCDKNAAALALDKNSRQRVGSAKGARSNHDRGTGGEFRK